MESFWNTLIHRAEPLTASGIGRVIDNSVLLSSGLRTQDLAALVAECGFLVIRGTKHTLESFDGFCLNLGEPVSYADDSVGYGYERIVALDATPDRGISGRDAMPLHTDGVLFKNRVDIVSFYCAMAAGQDAFDGSTVISDQVAVLPRISDRIKNQLRQGVEYRIVEKGYFTLQPDDWFHDDAFYDYGEGEVMRIALPYFEETPTRSWDTRFSGLDQATSLALFRFLNERLLSPDCVYYHRWNEGDVMLLDNRRVLHGRTEIRGERILYNGQSVVPDWNGYRRFSPHGATF